MGGAGMEKGHHFHCCSSEVETFLKKKKLLHLSSILYCFKHNIQSFTINIQSENINIQSVRKEAKSCIV